MRPVFMTVFLVLACGLLNAQDWVGNIVVVSDKVEDVSSIEAVKRWMIKPGMTDKEKGLAVWETVVKFRHQCSPPNEYLEEMSNVHDPLKTMNVYGYGMCCCASSNIEGLARAVGLEARGRAVNHHSVPEVFWDGKWHYLDSSLVCYFEDETGFVYGVDDLIKVYKEFMAAHPGFNPPRSEPMKSFPPPFNTCRTARPQDGMLPAMIHSVESAWSCFDGSANEIYEYNYSMGYRANFRIRRGEVLTRNWSNKGLHVNMHGGDAPGGPLDATMDSNELKYQRAYGDLGNNRVGNGTLVYTVPFSHKAWPTGTWSLTNTAPKLPALMPADKRKPAEAVFRMHCPYVFLTGKVTIGGTAKAAEGVKVQFSDNLGLSWKDAWSLEQGGGFKKEIDISPLVFRRYDYYIKVIVQGEARVTELEMFNDIQHSQRALPALAAGNNTITVNASPAIDTLTIQPTLYKSRADKNVSLEDFQPEIKSVNYNDGVWASGGQGTLTFPVTTPGDIYAVRFGGGFRIRGKNDWIRLELSFDGGKKWVTADEVKGPVVGYCYYTDFSQVPAGARSVQVRYTLKNSNTTGIFNLAVYVDYWDTPNGRPSRSTAIAPLKVTYTMKGGGPGKHVQVIKNAGEKYRINCGGRPTMESIIVELAN